MRHRKSGLKLNRTSSHRKAMFRNMVTSLFKHQRIRTTATKAKELRSWADHLITLAKRGDLHARRQALSIVREKDIVHKLFEEAPARYGSIAGGYTRIVKLGRRPGDAAPVALIELVVPETTKKKKKKLKKTEKAAAMKPAAKKKAEAEKAEPAKKKAAPEKKAEVKDAEAEKKKPAAKKKTEAKKAEPAKKKAAAKEDEPAKKKTTSKSKKKEDTKDKK